MRKFLIICYLIGVVSGGGALFLRWNMVLPIPDAIDKATLIVFPALITFLLAPTGPDLVTVVLAIIALNLNGAIYAVAGAVLIGPVVVIYGFIKDLT